MAPRLSEINWDDMKFFLALARTGSLHRASDALGSGRTTVSRRLEALELSFEAKLFERSRAGLLLTHLGQSLLPHAESIEAQVAAASRQLALQKKETRETLRLSMPHFVAQSRIMDHVLDFVTANPDIDLDISLSRQIANLDQRESDLSIRFAYEVSEDAICRRLVTCSSAAYCSRDYAIKIKENDGVGLEWIGGAFPEHGRQAAWIAQTSYPKAVQRHFLREASPLIAFARAGKGLAMLPCFVGDADSSLIRAPFQKIREDRSLWLLLHRDMRKNPNIRLLIDYLVECVSKSRNHYQIG